MPFQSTRPRGARRAPASSTPMLVLFQSTRPRGARQAQRARQQHAEDVSIHAPAWGATGHVCQFREHLLVSIHAPAWGATCQKRFKGVPGVTFQSTRPCGARRRFGRLARIRRSFNPRARVGRDRRAGRDWAWRSVVSIHAPAWGATRPISTFRCLARFQSTRPRGARLQRPADCRATRAVSIHAPAWGATQGRTANLIAELEFQSTRPRGARLSKSDSSGLTVAFQSTRPRGARRYQAPNQMPMPCFNPRARVGRDVAPAR